jgi:hypothetical protein
MPCVQCGQPTRQQIAAQAQLARGALGIFVARLGQAWEPSLGAAIDRLVMLAGEGA